MRILLGSEPTQKEPEIDDKMEADIRALYKKERGKSAIYKRGGEWHETKAYLQFKDVFLSKLERDVQEEQDFAVNNDAEMPDTGGFYITKGDCMGCGQTLMIDTGTGHCEDCDNNDIEGLLKQLDKVVMLDSKGMSRILQKEADVTEIELKNLVKEQRESRECTVREALLYLGVKLEVNYMDEKHYPTPAQSKAKMTKYKAEHPEEWEADKKRIAKAEKEAHKIPRPKPKPKIIKEVKSLIKIDGIKEVISKINTMTAQDTALSIALLCGSLHYMVNFMNDKMAIKDKVETTDEDKEIIKFVMELIN